MSRQVRLDDDVVDALERSAQRTGGSLASTANAKLRQVLGILGSSPAPAMRTGRATVKAPTGKCSHPIGRRIGDRCAACGGTIGSKAAPALRR